jgi:Grap2 and cyclin-D-interacting
MKQVKMIVLGKESIVCYISVLSIGEFYGDGDEKGGTSTWYPEFLLFSYDMAPNTPNSAAVVKQKLTTLRILSAHLAKGIKSQNDADEGPSSLSDPLASLRDSATVFKAQTTKLGLLLVNKPLTYSALFKILDDLEKRVLLVLYGSTSYIKLRKDVFGSVFVAEVLSTFQEVFGALDILLNAIDKVISSPDHVDKDQVMFAVGKVFSACDLVLDLTNKGAPGILMKKVKEWTDLMEDALAELKEWREDIDDEAREDGNSGDDDVESEAERNTALEELAAGLSITDPAKLPGHRADLVDLLAESLRRVDLVVKLNQAASKRRIKKFPFHSPPFDDNTAEKQKTKDMTTLNEVILVVEQMQRDLDELAAAFYDFDVSLARSYIEKISDNATGIADKISVNWDGKEDDFTKWTTTWKRLINKTGLPSETPLS